MALWRSTGLMVATVMLVISGYILYALPDARRMNDSLPLARWCGVSRRGCCGGRFPDGGGLCGSGGGFFFAGSYPLGDANPGELRAVSQGVFASGMAILFLAAAFLVPPVAASSIALEREQDTYELLWLTMLWAVGHRASEDAERGGLFRIDVDCRAAGNQRICVSGRCGRAADHCRVYDGAGGGADEREHRRDAFRGSKVHDGRGVFELCTDISSVYRLPATHRNFGIHLRWFIATNLLESSQYPFVDLECLACGVALTDSAQPRQVWENLGGALLSLFVQAAIAYIVIAKAARMLGGPRESHV